MKKVVLFFVIAGVIIGAYFGYYSLQRWMINSELVADLEASSNYQQSLNQSKLEPLVKKQLLELNKQEENQLRQLAQRSKTLKEYHNQKEDFLDQLALENKVDVLLKQAKKPSQK